MALTLPSKIWTGRMDKSCHLLTTLSRSSNRDDAWMHLKRLITLCMSKPTGQHLEDLRASLERLFTVVLHRSKRSQDLFLQAPKAELASPRSLLLAQDGHLSAFSNPWKEMPGEKPLAKAFMHLQKPRAATAYDILWFKFCMQFSLIVLTVQMACRMHRRSLELYTASLV